MTDARVVLFKERMAQLRLLRERTGAPISVCDLALKACNGDPEAAAVWPSLLATRGVDTGDPYRHRCRDDCPPWPFARVETNVRFHRCHTHCAQHPDPRVHAVAILRELVNVDDSAIRGALSICNWSAIGALRFLREAGAPHV